MQLKKHNLLIISNFALFWPKKYLKVLLLTVSLPSRNSDPVAVLGFGLKIVDYGVKIAMKHYFLEQIIGY
jgi:hypothetical protein